MGDYYQQSLTIVEGPAPQEPPVNVAEAIGNIDPYEKLANLLDDLGWKISWGFDPQEWTAAVVKEIIDAEEQFTVDEGRYDELAQIGDLLIEFGFSWYGTVHPKYEYLGTHYIYTPELGLFQGECDDDGTVVISGDTILKWVNEASSLDELRTRIAQANGEAWNDALFLRRWELTGTNQLVGAIGVHEPFTEVVEARTEWMAQEATRQRRYDAGYEHVLITETRSIGRVSELQEA